MAGISWNYADYKPSQMEMRAEILSGQYLMYAFCGTGRSGKSYTALGVAIELCIKYAGMRVLFTRRTYASLYKTIVIQTLNTLLAKLADKLGGPIPKDLIKKMPTQQDGLLIFANGSIIQFVGVDGNPDSPRLQDIKGGDYGIIIADEANMQQPEVYSLYIHRCAQKIEGFNNLILYIYNPDPELPDWPDRLFEHGERPSDGSSIPPSMRRKMGLYRSTFVENQSNLSAGYSDMLDLLDDEHKATYIDGRMPEKRGKSFGRPLWAKVPEDMRFERMVIHCDPASTSNKRSCFKAVALMGLCQNQFWVLDCELTQKGTDAMLSAITRFYNDARSKYGFADNIDCWYEPKGLPSDFNDMQERFQLSAGLPILIPDKEQYGDKQAAIEAIYGMLCEREMLFWSDHLRGTKIGEEMEREHAKYDNTRRIQSIKIDFLDVVMRAAHKLGIGLKSGLSYGEDTVSFVSRSDDDEMYMEKILY